MPDVETSTPPTTPTPIGPDHPVASRAAVSQPLDAGRAPHDDPDGCHGGLTGGLQRGRTLVAEVDE
jgi:hypothetical protein